MKSKILILLFVLFSLKAYTQNNQVTKPINNSAVCNNSNFSGMEKSKDDQNKDKYSSQQGTYLMWLGYLNSNNQNATYRGYQEFNLNTIQSIPPDITNDNIIEAKLIGELDQSTQPFSTVNIFRHDGNQFSCSIDSTGWKYLDGDVHSGGIRTHLAAFNFATSNPSLKTVELDVLQQVKNKRQSGKLILGYKNASETNHNLLVDVKLHVKYNLPPAPSIAPNIIHYDLTHNSCKLYWHEISGPLLGYKVFMNGKQIRELDNNTTETTIPVNSNTSYTFVVVAYNSGGNSPNSNTISFTTQYIDGSNTVCYDGSQFTLLNKPPNAGTIYWTVSDTNLFTVNPSGNSTTLTRKGIDTGNATLSARINSTIGTVIATKTITSCPPPKIFGPSVICHGGTAIYTILNLPTSATVQWTRSPHLNMTTNGPTATITNLSGFGPVLPPLDLTPLGNGNDPFSLKPIEKLPLNECDVTNGWIQATISNPYIVVKENLITGRKCLNEVVLISPFPCATSNTTYYTLLLPEEYNPVSWSWTPTGNAWGANNSDGSYTIQVPNNLTVMATVSSTNACGPSSYSLILGASGGLMFVYPNPTSDIINIELNENEVFQAGIVNQSPFGGNVKQDITYDIRLYNGQGIMLRQATTKSSTVQFNVANLPAGIYYLHVYDGVSNTPEIKQILIER